MIGKFAFLFLAAFACVQATPSHNGNYILTQEAEPFSFWDIIKDTMDKLKEIIGKVTSALKDLAEKIKQVVGGWNINGIVQKIIEAIKNKLGQITEVVQKCIDSKKPAINAIAQEARAGAMKCADAAKQDLSQIGQMGWNLVADAGALLKEMVVGGGKCLIASDKKACFEKLKEKADPLVADMSETSHKILGQIAQTNSNLGSCLAAVTKKTNEDVSALVSEIKACAQE